MPTEERLVLELPLASGDEMRKLLRSTITVEGLQYFLYTTHLANLGGDEGRVAQAETIVERAQADRAASTGTYRGIFTCDCNFDPGDPPSSNLDGFFKDVWLEKGVGPGYTGSMENGIATRRIDYVYVDDWSGIPIDSVVVDTTPLQSDHFPVIATL